MLLWLFWNFIFKCCLIYYNIRLNLMKARFYNGLLLSDAMKRGSFMLIQGSFRNNLSLF